MLTSEGKPIVVKFLAKGPASQRHDVWLRQFPGRSARWGSCRFVFDPDCRDYDWLVVYDDLPSLPGERYSNRRETLACARRNSLLITTEPATVKTYSPCFVNQFGHVLTSQEPALLRHPAAVYSQPALHWFYGIGRSSFLDYDRMKAAPPPEKGKALSTVCSDKRQKHTLHELRHRFTTKLEAAIPELERFGHGVAGIDDKAEALDPYRCHLAIENHIALHHWTEKLADAFLGFCLPIYGGCPNVLDYFPAESLVEIDVFDFEGSLETIRATLDPEVYRRRLPAIQEARRRVLDTYNLFAVIAAIVESQHSPAAAAQAGESVFSRRALRSRRPFRHSMAFVRNCIACRSWTGAPQVSRKERGA